MTRHYWLENTQIVFLGRSVNLFYNNTADIRLYILNTPHTSVNQLSLYSLRHQTVTRLSIICDFSRTCHQLKFSKLTCPLLHHRRQRWGIHSAARGL